MFKAAEKALEKLTSSSSSKDKTASNLDLIDQLLVNNKSYSTTHKDAIAKIYEYRAPPSKHLAIITCMDARLNPFAMLGIKEGEAHLIRNGGGRLRDSMRSLIGSQTLLQTNKVMIIHHTDCGFSYFKHNSEVLAALKTKYGTQLPENANVWDNFAHELGMKKESGTEIAPLDFMPIRDLHESLKEDFLDYKACPLLDQQAEVRGFIYDTKTGLLNEVKMT